MPTDLTLAFKFVFEDSTQAYADVEMREQKVNPSFLNIRQNELHTTVNSQGNFGFHDFFQQEEGIGVQFQGLRNVLSEGGLMIASAANRVSDRVRSPSFRDLDFQALLPVSRQFAPELPPFTSVSRFSDGFAPQPIGVSVINHSYAFDDSAYQQFVIFRYIIQNNTASSLSTLYAGLFADWDISPLITPNRITTQNAASNTAGLKLGYTYDVRRIDSTYYGVALLTDQDFRTYAGDANATTFGSTTKFNMLRGLPGAPTGSIGMNGNGLDAYQVVGAGPMNIAPGAYDTIAFAIMAGSGLNHLENQTLAAREAYTCRILGKGPLYNFFVGDTLLAIDQLVAFNDLNTNATQWNWDFGDGNSSNVSNPAHSYSASGQYTVTLEASNAECRRTFTRTLTVSPAVSIDPPIIPAKMIVVQSDDRLELTGSHWSPGTTHLAMRDIQSRIVYQVSRPWGESWVHTIDKKGLAPGMYILEARGKQQQLTQRVLIR